MSAHASRHRSAEAIDLARGGPARLVRAAQKGDRAAFAELYQRYVGLVRSIARARLPPDDAADAAQEAFLRAWTRLSSLRQAGSFVTWLATITRNVVCDVERQRSLETACGDEPRRPDTQDEVMQARSALRAIRALPPAYRTTIRMRLVEGMTGREIAERTGLSAGSVRVNLHRGMKMLRAQLEGAVTRKKRA